MLNIVLASHGNYAQGIYETMKYFTNELSHISFVNLEDKSIYDFEEEIDKLLTQFTGEILVLCDLYQGTPFKTFFSKLYGRKDAAIISNISFYNALVVSIDKNLSLDDAIKMISNSNQIEIKKMDSIIGLSEEDE